MIAEKVYKALGACSHKAFTAWVAPKDREFVWITDAKDIITPLIEEAYKKGLEDGKGDAWENGYKAGVNSMANKVTSAVNNAIIEVLKHD